MTTIHPGDSAVAGLRPLLPPCAQPVPFLPLRRITARTAIWSFLLGTALVCPVVIAVGLLSLPAITPDATRPERFLSYVLQPGTIFLKAVVIAPLWEEMFYRGLILQLARRYLPAWGAILLSTTIFAVPHAGMGLGTAVMAFLIGTVLAWIVVRSGSLYASFLCHATVNLTWLFVLGPAFGITGKILTYSPASPRINPLTDLFPVWWIALSLGLSTAGAVMLTRKPSVGRPPVAADIPVSIDCH
jgi:membrane protease YdiL (CAAX protease family)